MNYITRVQLWWICVQDTVTVITVFLAIILSWLSLDYCNSIEPDYSAYTKTTKLINAEYETLYTHNGYTDAVPKVTGVLYHVTFEANDLTWEQDIFLQKNYTEICAYLDTKQWDKLLLKYKPLSPHRVTITLEEGSGLNNVKY